MKYLDYFEQTTKDLNSRSKISSGEWIDSGSVPCERYRVIFEYLGYTANLILEVDGDVETWSVVIDTFDHVVKEPSFEKALIKANSIIADFETWKEKGVIPNVDKEYDENTWVYVAKYPEKGELMIVADVRYTVMANRKDGTYKTRTITFRGKDDLSEGFTDDVYSYMETLLD